MMLRTITIVIVCLCSCFCKAQNSFYTGFDDIIEKYYPSIPSGDAVYVTELQQPQFAEGLIGRALDLSEKAPLRKPLVVDSLSTPNYDESISLSVRVWVKTLENAAQGTVIIGNKPKEDLKSAGWIIYTQESGAWAVNI
ncbi:hypothetical protein [Snuella lapsa]|uniref:Uncharacterized protein n=1 Tax=Snuella lapsa TaxID=870481 RepID=A0ABP6YHV0_9FLAO